MERERPRERERLKMDLERERERPPSGDSPRRAREREREPLTARLAGGEEVGAQAADEPFEEALEEGGGCEGVA